MKPTTHPIGPGTCNLSVNVLKWIRFWLGRLAFRYDVSMGAVVRAMIARSAAVWAAHYIAEKSASEDANALAVLARAQHPASPGGVNITPEELAPAVARIERSKTLDRRISESVDIKQEIENARRHNRRLVVAA